MIKIYQSVDSQDCLAACISSIMHISLEEFPPYHYFYQYIDDNPFMGNWIQFYDSFLRSNLGLYWKIFGNPDSSVEQLHDNSYYIGTLAQNTNYMAHSVVMQNGKIIHDPYPEHILYTSEELTRHTLKKDRIILSGQQRYLRFK